MKNYKFILILTIYLFSFIFYYPFVFSDEVLDNETEDNETEDNETIQHLKEIFANATDFSTCESKEDLLKFPEGTYLEKCIREYTGYTRWPISCDAAESITVLKCSDPTITSLEGVQQLVNLQLLDMGNLGTEIDSLMPLRNLTKLQSIEIPNSKITNIEYLTALPQLNTLNLSGNQITDLTYFPYLTKVYKLILSYQWPNYIRDISPLAYMPSLETLSLQGNKISDISALSFLSSLRYLSIRDNRITSIAPLANKSQLHTVDFAINLVSDISPFATNDNLTTIIGDTNKISSVEVLRNLENIREISFKHNSISDVSPISDKSYLQSVAFDFNDVTDVSSIYNIRVNSNVKTLRFTYNCIPEDNYKKIKYLSKIEDAHFENQCEEYPLDNVYINGENIVNVDILEGQVWEDNATFDDIKSGAGCSIVKSRSTAGDIVIILSLIILLYRAILLLCRFML